MANNRPRVFADTDVCLDLLSGRKPFNAAAERLFSLADLGKIEVGVSSLSFANIDYILQSQYKKRDSRKILAEFKTLVSVLPVDNTIIELAIHSDLADFEDAIQYYTAMQGKIPVLVDTKDYSNGSIRVMTPEAFMSGL